MKVVMNDPIGPAQAILATRPVATSPSCVSTTARATGVYCLRRGTTLVVLLCGGDKATQDKDIKQATELRRSGDTLASTEFSPYDSADYLTSLDDVALYLEAALEEAGDDPAFIAQVLGTIARSRNMSELARRVGMSREGLFKALSADGNPSFATIMKVAKALGLKIEFHAVA